MTPPPSLKEFEKVISDLVMILQTTIEMGGFQAPTVKDFVYNEVRSALYQAHTQGREAGRLDAAVEVEALDPLLAIADWENSDDIAYAVQRHILAALRAKKGGGNGTR